MSERLWHLLSGKLDEIAALYKVRPRITLIVRVPGKPKECAFLSDDSWADAVATVRDLYGDPTAFAAGPPEPVADATPAPPQAREVPDAETYGAWKAAALRVGEELAPTGPDGYYNFGPSRWLEWALSQIKPVAPPQAREVEAAAEAALVTLRNGAAHLLAMKDGAHNCRGCGLLHDEWREAATLLESALARGGA